MTEESDSPPKAEFVERRRWPRTTQSIFDTGCGGTSELVPLRFDTGQLPPHKQFSAWREHISVLLQARLPDDIVPDDGFVARQSVWNLGGILLLQQVNAPFSYTRSQEMVRFSSIDYWQITFLRSGETWTGVDGCVAHNTPGLIEFRSFGYPFSGRSLAAESVSLIVPVDLFADRGGLPAACNNVIFGGYRARLVIDNLSNIEASLERLAMKDLPDIRDSIRLMVISLVASLINQGGTEHQISQQFGLMVRARRYVMENLASHDLTPDTLGQELAISRTRLYDLFETSGGVANYIRRRRLSVAHAMLADPSETRRIAEIGLATGFDSAANFSRAFMQNFGYSPTHMRKQVLDQSPAGPVSGNSQVTFDSLLRALGSY